MEPILTIDNLNSFGGNMLRQGDKSQLKYRLRDVGNKNLGISGKSCQVKMYGRNYTTVVYETTTTVTTENTVSFTIDKVLPKGTFYLEFTVGDYIFPTDHREFFEITPSGKGMESNIIEIVGVDAVVRKAVELINVDPSLIIDEDKLVTDIISNTGIGNINEYYQAFNDLKPKAEQSISRSLEALTKSQNALNVANGIDAKATNALSLSESADTLSKSVQEQFNQVIIDGDSSVEAAQARVDASGHTNPTLKARLDKEHNEVTAQLAQTVKKGQVSINDININLGKITPNMVSDELLAQIAGDAAVNAVPADGSLTTEKFSNKSVTLSKLNIDGYLPKPLIIETENVSGSRKFARTYLHAGDIVKLNGEFQVAITKIDEPTGTFLDGYGGRPEWSYDNWAVQEDSLYYIRIRLESNAVIIGDYLDDLMNRGVLILTSDTAVTKKELDVSFNDLQSRVGTTNAKVANLANQLSEISDNNSVSEPSNFLRVDDVKDFTFLLDIGNKEYAGHRFRKDDAEDFIKKYEESIYGEDIEIKYENYDYAHYRLPGSIEPTLVTNQYTTRVGTIINHDFTGSKITLRHIVRYDGGLWKASIDGIFIKNISTHQANTGAKQAETLIADNLSEGTHTLTLEFMGIDPDSPATTSDLVTPNNTPRGWITVDLGTTPEKATFKVESKVSDIAKKFDITSGFSNKEFAFEVEQTKDEGSQWFPSHFGIPTTNKGDSGFQYLLLDGEEVNIDNPSSNLIPFSKAQFVQVLESKRTDDTEVRAKIKLVMTIEGAKMKQSFEIEFLQDTFIRNAYVFMIPTLNTYLGQMVTDRSERLLVNTSDLGTSTFAKNIDVSRIIATSNNENMKDYYLQVDLSQNDLVINNLYLQHRSDGIHQKLYLKTHSQHEALSGDIFQVEGTWEVNRLKNANGVYG